MSAHSRDGGGAHHIPDLSRARIGSWLQTVRLAADKTQREAADFLGVEKQTVSNWETGRHPIRAEDMLRLVVYYKADILELLAKRVAKSA